MKYYLKIQRLRLLIEIFSMGKDRPPLNPIMHDYYHKKISEGKLKNQALKCVQRRLVNIVYGMMKHKRPYVERHVLTDSA